MGKKDAQLKWYLGKDKIFADFCNGALYGGKEVILPENLAEVQRFYQESLSDRAGNRRRPQRERDVAKLLCQKEGCVIVALENQDEENPYMPLRCLEYDVEDLQRQLRHLKRYYQRNGGLVSGKEYLSGIKDTDRLIPTVTFVVFHGKGEWKAATGLRELLDLSGVDAVLQGMLADYRIWVLNFAKLKEENFKTGLRELVGMFKRRDSMREMQKYCAENRERFRNMDEDTYDVICALLQLQSLEKKEAGSGRRGKERINMCKAFDDWAKEEQEKGRKEGRKEGERIGKAQGEIRLGMLIDRLLGEGRTADARKAATDLQVRRRLYQEYGIG